MKSVEVNIRDIRENQNNPRLIKDDKFKKLVQSIKDFPQMLAIRPIVVNADMTVLGGNMRLKACKEAGLEKVPVIMANDLTEEQQKEFIIKDNVGFGEWDWEVIANEWDTEQLTEWGMDIFWNKSSINELSEDDLDFTEEFDPVGKSSEFQRVVFIFTNKEQAESYLNKIGVKFEKRNMAWQVNMNTQFI